MNYLNVHMLLFFSKILFLFHQAATHIDSDRFTHKFAGQDFHSRLDRDHTRLETCWASDMLKDGDGFVTIPTNIIPGVFTQAAFDNGDYGQENSSQHVTNTVFIPIQRR